MTHEKPKSVWCKTRRSEFKFHRADCFNSPRRALTLNPAIEPIHHFLLSLEGKLVRADEEQRIESLRPANRVITPAQVFNGSLNTVGGKQIILLPVRSEERRVG